MPKIKNVSWCLFLDSIQMFDLMQTVDKPTHRCGHILDWILHRREDDILWTTHVSHQLTSDHFIIVCDLDLFVPSPPPTFICKRKLSSIDNCILMQDIKDAWLNVNLLVYVICSPYKFQICIVSKWNDISVQLLDTSF